MLHLLFWVFILILGLSYFGLSIETILNTPAGQENLAFVMRLLSDLWQWIVTYAQHFKS